MEKTSRTHVLPLGVTISLNIQVDGEGNRRVAYNFIGPFGSTSSVLSNIDRNFKPHSIKELEQELAECLNEFVDRQLESYSRRDQESMGEGV